MKDVFLYVDDIAFIYTTIPQMAKELNELKIWSMKK